MKTLACLGLVVTMWAVIPVGTAAADHPARARLTPLTVWSAAYAANALCGARVAIRDTLPEEPFGRRSNRSAREGFFRAGTALSPGLPMLTTQLLATVLAEQPGSAGRAGSAALAVHGGLYLAGALIEPETYRVLRHPRRAGAAKVAIVLGNLALPPLLGHEAVRAYWEF